MRIRARTTLVFALAVALVAGSARAQDPDQTKRKESRGGNVLDLASMLSGTWKGATPGNELTATIVGTGFSGSSLEYNLSTTVIGKYQSTNVWLQGVLHVENQGRDLFIAYVPHFNPASGGLGFGALRFTREELASACSFYLAPAGDGFAGDTRGSATCARAIRGAIGKWSVQAEPGTIRIQSEKSGETLRFEKTSK